LGVTGGASYLATEGGRSDLRGILQARSFVRNVLRLTLGAASGGGRREIAGDSLGVEQAIMVALREMKEQFSDGWPIGVPPARSNL